MIHPLPYDPHVLGEHLGRNTVSDTHNLTGDDSPLLTQSEVGHLFRVTRRTVQRWSKSRLIPSVTIGRTVRYDIRELHELMSRDDTGVNQGRTR